MENKHLRIYLNDHLSGSVVGLNLARRARDHNDGTQLGDALAGIATEIEEDRETLLEIMESLEIPVNPVKQAGAWFTEKAMRLKLNGQLVGYSPASRLIEIETLMLGVSGKLGLWRALAAAGLNLEGFDLAKLIARAENQRDELERWRIVAAEVALPGSVGGDAAPSAA